MRTFFIRSLPAPHSSAVVSTVKGVQALRGFVRHGHHADRQLFLCLQQLAGRSGGRGGAACPCLQELPAWANINLLTAYFSQIRTCVFW